MLRAARISILVLLVVLFGGWQQGCLHAGLNTGHGYPLTQMGMYFEIETTPYLVDMCLSWGWLKKGRTYGGYGKAFTWDITFTTAARDPKLAEEYWSTSPDTPEADGGLPDEGPSD